MALAAELNYSLNLTIQPSAIKVRRGASATAASSRASASVKSARASAKAQMKAEGKVRAREEEVQILEQQI